MHKPEINRLTGKIVLALSSIALLTVLSGYLQPPQTDEGAAAHIFQLSIVLLALTLLLFLGTADWTEPWRTARPLVVSAVVLALAFGALYYLENYRDPHYQRSHLDRRMRFAATGRSWVRFFSRY
jgi:heme/copper-type cytochrome/quinol oxidase subunit 4